jgi:hypothetical protein
MTQKLIVHEIQNQVIFLDPPIEYARSTWIRSYMIGWVLVTVFLLDAES